MLSYRCTNTCRHCLYRCSPRQPDEWLTLGAARRIFEALAQEPQLDSIHIAGGEPTLRMELLLDLIRLAREVNLPVAYVETNASWCESREYTRHQMERMQDAGLPALLVSVSMFHNEFVPFSMTRNCVEVARSVFGSQNVLLYLPHMYDLLARMPDDGTHTLEAFQAWARLENQPGMIPQLYQVIPAGRAPEGLRHCYETMPAEALRGQTCEMELLSTTHFHIDHNGDLFTGLCAGIAPARVEDLHPRIEPDTHPVFCRLCEEGPFGLMQVAVRRYGFTPREDGYVSKCDLCFDVRRALQGTGGSIELRPASFYSA
jgi:hypothetical protein